MRHIAGSGPIAAGLVAVLLLAAAVRAKVARTSLGEMARSADTIVIARVERVAAHDGLSVARALPLEVLKGSVGDGSFYFIASPTWSCDMSAAVQGETALLLLDTATSDQFSRKGSRQPSVRVPVTPLYTLTHAGRGRLPQRMVNGQAQLVLPFDVDVPRIAATPPGSGSERTSLRTAVIEVIRQELRSALPTKRATR